MPIIPAGLEPPATATPPSPHAATVRAAHLTGSLERVMLPVTPRGVRDQRALEACVSCACAAAMEIRNGSWPLLSAMYHYRAARVERGAGDTHGRLTLTEGLMTLEGSGLSTYRLHNVAFDETGLAQVPLPSAKADALTRRLQRRGVFGSWESIGSASRVVSTRRHLKRERPVLLGMLLPRGYPGTFLGAGHQWDDPSVPLLSDGHCVLVIGFDDRRQALRIQDSRGEHARFDEGCWWMGYTVADSAAIVAAAAVL